MERSEVTTAASHLGVAFSHPRWWVAYLRGGRRELVRRIVADSISSLRRETPPRSIAEAVARPPSSPIGRLGAPQEYLYRIVRALRPTTVVETGVYRGISTAFLLAGLEDSGGGRLVSVDLPDHRYTSGTVHDSAPFAHGETTGYAIPDELRARWTLVVGETRTALPPLLETLGPIDLFLHDSEHTAEAMRFEFDLAVRHLRPGGVLASDDVGWNRAFAELVREQPFSFSTVVGRRLGVAVVRSPLGGSTPSVANGQ